MKPYSAILLAALSSPALALPEEPDRLEQAQIALCDSVTQWAALAIKFRAQGMSLREQLTLISAQTTQPGVAYVFVKHSGLTTAVRINRAKNPVAEAARIRSECLGGYMLDKFVQ